jgi:hypothetical protein
VLVVLHIDGVHEVSCPFLMSHHDEGLSEGDTPGILW